MAIGALASAVLGVVLVSPALVGLGGGSAAAAPAISPNSVVAEGIESAEAPGATGAPGPVVGLAADPAGTGYWTVSSAGAVGVVGSVASYGSLAGDALNAPVVGIAATPTGSGYWLVAADGGVFSFGTARFHGSTGTMTLNKPIVGMAAAPTGGGYWLVASDGGVFSFGTALFHGSTGAMVLNKPVVGMAAAPTGNGYWLVASDGGIFTFGTIQFYGSTGAMALNAPIVGMAAYPQGGGYWLVASDGGIFSFGNAPFLGSAVGGPLDAPVVGMASGPNGYWIARGSTAPLTSPLGQEEVLAQLGYLPVSWTEQGGFAWRWPVPAQLASLWVPGQYNTVLKGAIYAFDSVAGLAMTGELTSTEIGALVSAAYDPSAYGDPYGYSYALTQEHVGTPIDETLMVWHTGVLVAQSPANTGIATRPTTPGTFPVYLRYRNQIMTGINPNGTPYADPVQYVAYFNGSDAIHYFPRATYGWPQSLGCVELPLTVAAVVWNYTTYGTLVTVTLD